MIEIVQNHLDLDTLTCPNKKQATMLCISPQCLQSSLSCLNDTCQSCSSHNKCHLYKLNTVVQELVKKRRSPTQEVFQMVAAITKIYDEAIDRLSIDRIKVIQSIQTYGLSQKEGMLLTLLKQQKFQKIKGKLISQILPTLTSKYLLQTNKKTYEAFWQVKKLQFNEIFEKIFQLMSSKNKLNSLITNQCQIIQSFFTKKIKSFKLLYRASENNFSAEAFHKKCDEESDTLVIAQTQFNKVIGGFTPLKWKPSLLNCDGSFIPDNKLQTFIFSVTNMQKYTLADPTKAIFTRKQYGPTFGVGHDIYIPDNANFNTEGFCNFPKSYQKGVQTHPFGINMKRAKKTATSAFPIDQTNTLQPQQQFLTKNMQVWNKFSGSTNSYFVKFTEWQVFKVIFEQ